MSGSLIAPEQGFALWAVLIGLAAFGFWCERYPWGRRYSGVMLVISLGILLSNLRIIPTAAPVYDVVWTDLVPVAIALLLLDADLGRIVRESGATLLAFVIGALAVLAGALLAVMLVPLGDDTPALGGILAASYIGGSLNFAAVSEATGVRDGSLLTAALAADNLVTNLHYLLLILLPGVLWVARLFARPGVAVEVARDQLGFDAQRHRIADLDVPGLLAGVALAFGLTELSRALAMWLGTPQYAILILTAATVALATACPGAARRCTGAFELGTALLFVFLASVGASADLWVLLERAPRLFAFCLVIVATHTLVVLVAGRLLRLELGEIIVASASCIGGPASGAAMASARGWSHLVTPGVLSGSLGYAIGSFLGMLLFDLLQ